MVNETVSISAVGSETSTGCLEKTLYHWYLPVLLWKSGGLNGDTDTGAGGWSHLRMIRS
jgi:hypothetical protein